MSGHLQHNLHLALCTTKPSETDSRVATRILEINALDAPGLPGDPLR